MADYLPLFNEGEPFTVAASEKVTGGQLVAVTGDRTVGVADANDDAIGVAGFDADTGDYVTVYPGGVQRPVGSGAITAGARVAAAAAGKVSTTGTNFLGTALAASANGEPATIKLDR